MAIRITDNPEPGAIARRLGLCRSLLCAAPRWLQQHGPLATLDDLQQHNCLLYSHFAGQRWQFSDAQGQEASVAVSGNLSAGISSLLLEAAVAGCGIAMLPELEARSALASGALEVVLPDWTPKALERLWHLSFPRLSARWATAVSGCAAATSGEIAAVA